MRLHVQRANPGVGPESILLRFEGLLPERTVCLLVDPGRGVDVDELLNESRDEYLAGIVVTHAHYEHYCTLGQNLGDGTPVYAAADTATILEGMIAGPSPPSITNEDAVLDQLTGTDGWEQLVHGIRLHPIQAGHAPGAAGFVIEATDESGSHTLLVTGDVTTRPAAGYAGFDVDLSSNVDVLVCPAAANDGFEQTLTEAVATICERATTGSTVLVTADGPTGVHVAYLLGHLVGRLDSPFPVTAVGRIAGLCRRLGYAIPHVATLPSFPDLDDVLTAGGVTIAGPSAAVEGTSAHLFDRVADDADAAVVRLTTGPTTPMTTARCTVQSFALHNYPDRNTLAGLVDAVAPTYVVACPREDVTAATFEGVTDSFLWMPTDDRVHTLYDGTNWTTPPGCSDEVVRQVRRRAAERQSEPPLSEYGFTVPIPERSGAVDLEREGLDVEAIRQRLSKSGRSREAPAGTATSPSVVATHANGDSAAHPTTESPIEPERAIDVARGTTADWPTELSAHTHANGYTSAGGQHTNGATLPTGSLGQNDDVSSLISSLTDVLDRLGHGEHTGGNRTYRARVVDADEDVCLFRLDDPPESFDHGQSVTVVLDEITADAADE